ncbi:MAG: sulfite exporter TauE/SafE family protein [Burkholderiaceae bacterium]
MITDPAFYAVAVPAALLVGIGKAGIPGGLGMLAVPLMALSIPVPAAAAIVLPLLTVGDLFGLAALIRQRERALLRTLLPSGLVGIVIGLGLFHVLSARAMGGFVGVMTLLFLVQRALVKPSAQARAMPRWAGVLAGTVSGVTSFAAHAGGPPISMYLLPMKLAPTVFAATGAVFFAAINASKWLPYAWLGLIDWTNMSTALVLAPCAAAGVAIGVFVLRRLPALWFYRLVSVGLFVTGVKLIWDALR